MMKKKVSKAMVVVSIVLLAGCGPGVWMDREQYRLRAFANTAAMEGSMSGFVFMMAGSFEEEDYFIAYIESPNGAIRLQRFNSDEVVIYEFEGDQTPTATRLRLKGGINAGLTAWRFRVPAGSIRPVINIMGGFENG